MDQFIKKHKPKVLVKDDTSSYIFAWHMLWPENTLICFMGDMGYGDPMEYKKELKGKINYFDWMPINDKNCRWEKVREKEEEN